MKDPVARADPRVIMRQTGGAAPGAGQHRRRQSRQRRATDGAGEDDLNGRAAADRRTAPEADGRACTDRGLLMTGLVFRGATLIDGTGSDERLADVFVTMGVITAIEEPGRMRGAVGRTIDADGLVLAPGFIDAHTHGDAAPFLPEIDDSKISQGVTTEVVGNCGFSLAPCPPSRRADIAELCGRLFPRLPFDWSSTADLHAQLDAAGSVTNTVALAGHSTLRAAAMGLDDRRAEPAEVDSMRADLRAALAAGARGLSSGLIYPPGMYSDADELVELASLLGEEDVYTTHIRNEGRQLHESVREAIMVARRAGCRLQVSHLKAAGQASWGGVPAALRLMDVARRSGMTVHHDVYPYDANSTMLASCLPPWFHDGGYAATMARLHDPLALARAERELERSDGTWQNWVAESGWTNVLIASTAAHRHEGLTLDRIAKSSGPPPVRGTGRDPRRQRPAGDDVRLRYVRRRHRGGADPPVRDRRVRRPPARHRRQAAPALVRHLYPGPRALRPGDQVPVVAPGRREDDVADRRGVRPPRPRRHQGGSRGRRHPVRPRVDRRYGHVP